MISLARATHNSGVGLGDLGDLGQVVYLSSPEHFIKFELLQACVVVNVRSLLGGRSHGASGAIWQWLLDVQDAGRALIAKMEHVIR